MNETHLPNDQFNFNGIHGVIRTENFELYRGNMLILTINGMMKKLYLKHDRKQTIK